MKVFIFLFTAIIFMITTKFLKKEEEKGRYIKFLLYFLLASCVWLKIGEFPLPLGAAICAFLIRDSKKVANRKIKWLAIIFALFVYISDFFVPKTSIQEMKRIKLETDITNKIPGIKENVIATYSYQNPEFIKEDLKKWIKGKDNIETSAFDIMKTWVLKKHQIQVPNADWLDVNSFDYFNIYEFDPYILGSKKIAVARLSITGEKVEYIGFIDMKEDKNKKLIYVIEQENDFQNIGD